MRPGKVSGWREIIGARGRAMVAFVDSLPDAKSAWIRRGVTVISALELAEAPDGTKQTIPQHHISIGHADGRRPTDIEVKQARACFGMSEAEEDNHSPGVARHLWLPCDPRRRVSCECKATEEVITESDGYTYSQERGTCAGCELDAVRAQLDGGDLLPKICKLHWSPYKPQESAA